MARDRRRGRGAPVGPVAKSLDTERGSTMTITLAAPGMSTRVRVLLWLLTWLLSGAALTGLCILFADRPISPWSHDVLHRPVLAVDITKVAGAVYMAAAALAVLMAGGGARLGGQRMGPGGG